MNSSVRLFDVFGITLKMHLTFPLILIWAMLQFGLGAGLGWTGALFGVVVTLLLFGIVVLHELGHSLAALRYDINVEDIIMLPIGGVARIPEIPEEPGKEFVIAIAGPAVNFAIAGILLALNAIGLLPINFASPAQLLQGLDRITIGTLFGYLWYVNLFIAVFNLLPAFPMDGGRILRAGLATFLSYGRATSIAATIGQVLAAGLGLLGFFNGDLFLIIIAFFIYTGANQESNQTQLRGLLKGVTVANAYSRDAQTLTPQTTLRTAVEKTLSSLQQDFPVCDDSGRIVGMLPYRVLLEAVGDNEPDTPVREVMQSDFDTVSPDDELFAVQQQMSQLMNDAVPVVENGEFVGLLTTRDVQEVFRLATTRDQFFNRSDNNLTHSPA